MAVFPITGAISTRSRIAGRKMAGWRIRAGIPLEPGLKEIFARYKRVMTVEINYSDDLGDPLIDETSRRYAQLAWLLRATTLVDVDCWTRVPGQPLRPRGIHEAIRTALSRGRNT